MSGCFSYSEIPKKINYQRILGVTGTLQSLGKYEKEVIKEHYKINKWCITPSVYGKANLKFSEIEDILVLNSFEDY